MLRERITHYRKVANEATDPMARILVEEMIEMFETEERSETGKASDEQRFPDITR